MTNDIIKRENNRAYVDSLINAGVKYSAEAWREIIEAEAEDLGEEVDVDYVIEWLDEEGYVLPSGTVINQYGVVNLKGEEEEA